MWRWVWRGSPCGARGTQVYRIDPFTFESKEIPIDRGPASGVPGGIPTGVHVDKETLWACFDTGNLYRVDALNERVVGVVEGVNADLCAVGEGSLWAVDRLGSTVTPVDLDTGRSGKQIIVPGSVDQIAAGAGGVWLLDGDAGTVSRIDPKARTVDAPIGIGSGASSITAAFGAVWVTVPADRDIVRIDPLTADVQRIAVNAAGIWSAPDTRTGWLWLVVEPPADVGTGFG
jgi:streptogramin lyase